MDPGSGMLLEDFGQRVDLTRRIREVLANYPEGTTALRELIQNADDAGASRVRLCLDRRSHGAASLLAPALAQWQGPHCSRTTTPCSPTRTLPAYPALATAGRWPRHGRLVASGRFSRLVFRALSWFGVVTCSFKLPRWGNCFRTCAFCYLRVGFNSVYHLTDLPSFVSGKYVVVFDPQGAYLPNVSSANPGKRIDYVSSSAISMYTDQAVTISCIWL
ncbi:hypothetical protein PR202_gb13944 [Eleusine coracana subsp. coracana]|uniref:Sacsin/Nov domain-containing protein n=1 Tax=Eleusine coracana subsp. coracana TaxID=191504 RepID=A0AAV5ETW8_ELECO|nr:hypothetical protein PR202_gb13944 [Eleusine coracana subsp. coracana]